MLRETLDAAKSGVLDYDWQEEVSDKIVVVTGKQEGEMKQTGRGERRSNASVVERQASKDLLSDPKCGNNESAFPDINTHRIPCADKLLAISEKKSIGLHSPPPKKKRFLQSPNHLIHHVRTHSHIA